MTTPNVRFETLIDLYHGEIYAYLWRTMAAAGGPFTAVVKECTVQAVGRLTVGLVPNRGEPVLSGVEILPQRSAPTE